MINFIINCISYHKEYLLALLNMKDMDTGVPNLLKMRSTGMYGLVYHIKQNNSTEEENTIRVADYTNKSLIPLNIKIERNNKSRCEALYAFKYISDDNLSQDYGIENLLEIDILRRISHPHIMRSIEILTPLSVDIKGIACILPLGNRTLSDVMIDPLMTTDEKLPIFYKLAHGLHFMHNNNILHMDIQPNNVILQESKKKKKCIPYFINFQSSILIDDISLQEQQNKNQQNDQPTFYHKPPELLNGCNVYNKATDIWSFGIMMLSVISGRTVFPGDYEKLSQPDFAKLISSLFCDTKIYDNLLCGVRPHYKDLATDLFSKMLQIDPSNRIMVEDVLNHPIFNKFRSIHVDDGVILNPSISSIHSDDHRDILKLLIQWASEIYGNKSSQILFLAIDLFFRLASHYVNLQPIDRMVCASTSLWMASKIICKNNMPLSTYVSQINTLVPDITLQSIIKTEQQAVSHLSGILNVSEYYNSCKTVDHLRWTLQYIILNRDPTIYSQVDIPEWIKEMDKHIISSENSSKNITIASLLSG